jgi:hypothetical protein
MVFQPYKAPSRSIGGQKLLELAHKELIEYGRCYLVSLSNASFSSMANVIEMNHLILVSSKRANPETLL